MSIELENLSLRKRMLIVRAELERTELAGQVCKLSLHSSMSTHSLPLRS